jgi:hypothetical protein
VRRVSMPRDGKRIDMAFDGRAKTLAVQGGRGINFASVIQRGSTAKKVNI